FAREAREVAHRPRVLLVLRRQRRDAAADEELRDLAVVQVWADRQRVLRADAVEDREDVVLFDELSGQRDGLGDLELVVLVLVDDLAPEDAALRVDVLEVGVGAPGHGGVSGGGAGERNRAAARDRRCRYAG